MKYAKSITALTAAVLMSVSMHAEQIPFDEEHFPDEGVRTWLQSVSGAVSNDMVETDKVTSLPNSKYASDIVDFSCAKYFTKLKGSLSFGYSTWTKLERLDISGLTGVTSLDNGLTGNAISGTLYHMDSMKELVADGCTGLTSVIFPLCKNMEYASFQGCTALSTFWIYGKMLGSVDNYNYKLKALDISASDKLTYVWVSGNKEMKTFKLGDNLPNLTNLQCTDTKVRSLNLKGMTSTSAVTLNVQSNRLRHIDVSSILYFKSFYYNSNALTSIALDHIKGWTSSPNTNNQKVYCGKETTEFTVIERLPKYQNYKLNLKGATFREEDNGDGTKRVVCTFNAGVTQATYTYQPYLMNFWSGTPAYQKAQLNVTLLRQDDPDIEEHDLWLVPAECDQNLTSFTDDIQLMYVGNGVYEYGSEANLMGNFRVEERSTATAARGGNTVYDFGGIAEEDTNPADEYMCIKELGTRYQMADGSSLNFTTHPDQGAVNSDVEDKVMAVIKPKVTVDYRPEDDVRTIRINSLSTDNSTTGIEDAAATDNEGVAEYFTLHGVRVDGASLTPGIYVRRQGERTEKIAIR